MLNFVHFLVNMTRSTVVQHRTAPAISFLAPSSRSPRPHLSLQSNQFQAHYLYMHTLPMSASCQIPGSISFILWFMSCKPFEDLEDHQSLPLPRSRQHLLRNPCNSDTINIRSSLIGESTKLVCVRFDGLSQCFICLVPAMEYSSSRTLANFLRTPPIKACNLFSRSLPRAVVFPSSQMLLFFCDGSQHGFK